MINLPSRSDDCFREYFRHPRNLLRHSVDLLRHSRNLLRHSRNLLRHSRAGGNLTTAPGYKIPACAGMTVIHAGMTESIVPTTAIKEPERYD